MATSGVCTSAGSDAAAAPSAMRHSGAISARIDPSHSPVQRDARPVSNLSPLTSARSALKTSCLINNFNYAHYVSEAVESALAQTIAFDEIIVVDDGSTDESVEL